jgi:ubiquinone/menaquinone biosynthesis C-methylase UbiE
LTIRSSYVMTCPSHTRAVVHRYDTIGTVYGRHRRADPRILVQIEQALTDASSVINVGAGTGVYEPGGRRVVAVEPSEVMIAQRPTGGVPVVRAVAEALPVPDGSFDVALATFTVHHWTDPALGLREMRRVAKRQVVLTFDQDDQWLDEFWLTRDYLPHEPLRGALFSGLEQVIAELKPSRVEVVPVPANCLDGFFCAYWRHPEAYLDPEVRASISALALLDDDTIKPGLDRLAEDLRSGAWAARNQALLELDSYDYGYRLVVS